MSSKMKTRSRLPHEHANSKSKGPDLAIRFDSMM
jgi:hypothetical protein